MKNTADDFFNTAGDSIVAEFSGSVESVNAGIIIQQTLSDRNKKSDINSQFVWRIGIHLDDVIIEGDNIYGTGVNIAARLEGVCKPGENLVSRMASDQVRKRIRFAVNAEGKKSLRNISNPVEAFSITPKNSEKLESKIEEITVKVTKLIEQNAQYKRVLNDLKQRCALLEAENQKMHKEIAENQNNSDALDKESIKKQIDKYIQDIDLSIQWLSDLE